MNKNSNTYIIAYSCIMVVVVAFLLAFVSSSLKPAQDVNVALDKKKQILAALNIRNLSDQESAEQYAKVVDRDAVINADGKEIAKGGKGGETAGFLLNSADYKAGKLAVYYCTVDGKHKFVVPVYGMDSGDRSGDTSPLTKTATPFMAHTSTMRARQPDWEPKSRIQRLGRTSSAERPSMAPTANR